MKPAAPLPLEDLRHVLARTPGLWDELAESRIFITGGTGFFGCWLLETFLAANKALRLRAKAVVLTRDPVRFSNKAPHLAQNSAVELWQGDVTDFAFPPSRFTHVIHAATTSGGPVPVSETLATILHGTERALDFAAASGASRFLFTSSGAVYGAQPSALSHIPETYGGGPVLSTNPVAVYGEAKRMAELMCAVACKEKGLRATVARCFAFVGPHLPLDAHFAIGNFIRDALAGSPIRILGDGTPSRSYLYAADLAIWLWTILLKGEPARPYNVGSAQAVSVRELAETVGKLYNVPVSVAKEADPQIPPARYVPDITRAETELGLREYIKLEEAICRTARYYSEKP